MSPLWAIDTRPFHLAAGDCGRVVAGLRREVKATESLVWPFTVRL